MLQFVQHKPWNDHDAADEPCACHVRDAAVNDHARIQQDEPGLAAGGVLADQRADDAQQFALSPHKGDCAERREHTGYDDGGQGTKRARQHRERDSSQRAECEPHESAHDAEHQCARRESGQSAAQARVRGDNEARATGESQDATHGRSHRLAVQGLQGPARHQCQPADGPADFPTQRRGDQHDREAENEMQRHVAP